MPIEIYSIDADNYGYRFELYGTKIDQPFKPNIQGIQHMTEDEALIIGENHYIEIQQQSIAELSFEELQVEQNVDFDYRLSLLEMGLA